jgi:CheY-like chemotaxis protein
MSHEIRTPMNAILGMAHLALRADLNARQHNYVSKIERSAKTLLGVINDILDFSKIEADKIELERTEFPLADVLDDVANLVALQAEDKGLELVFDVAADLPDTLLGDPLRLSQVLINLASNGVKFTERGELVLAVRRVDAERGVGLRFSVTDSGAGITPQHLERLFQPFEQADASTSRQHGGTGLGLAISQRLVRAMGGELEVQSTQGLGSSFSFELAFELPPGAPASVPLPSRMAGERVLVVDDNLHTRAALVALCRAGGLRADGVGDLAAARRALGAPPGGAPYRVLLLDASLAGVECAAWVREMRATAIVPILSCTTLGHDSLMLSLARSGLDEVALLVKPVLPASGLEVLAAALGAAGDARGPAAIGCPGCACCWSTITRSTRSSPARSCARPAFSSASPAMGATRSSGCAARSSTWC